MQRVAIVGLGRVGSRFLQGLLPWASRGIEIVAVSETESTPGRAAAQAAGIPVLGLPDLLARATEIDVLFDLSGQSIVRQTLRQGLARAGNFRTVIAPENVAQLVWALISAEELPQVHADLGYGA